LNNQDIFKGSYQGAGNNLLNTGGTMAMDSLGSLFANNGNNDEEWDIFGDQNTGTLGGTVENQYGERSSPGMLTPEQAQANAQANPGLGANYQLPTTATPNMRAQAAGPSQAVQTYLQALQGPQGQQQQGGYGDLAASVFGAYNAFNQRKQLRGQQRQLQELFSPNSPYAQQMRQRIERKDAAAGRRSQYGPREAQLAAMLSERQAATFPQQMQYQKGIGGLENMFVNNLLRGGQQAYKQAPRMGNDMENGLQWLMNLRGGQ
jgi:hypothetical protein